MLAAGTGDETRVRELLQHPQARASYKGGQALKAAAEHGRESIVRLLLDWPVHAPRADFRARRMARSKGHIRIVRLLRERMVASDTRTAARAAADAQALRLVCVRHGSIPPVHLPPGVLGPSHSHILICPTSTLTCCCLPLCAAATVVSPSTRHSTGAYASTHPGCPPAL